MNFMQHMTRFLLLLAESGFIPDSLIKIAARYISSRRLIESTHSNNKDEIISALSKGAVAEKTYDANEQHYEVPPEFFNQVLGANLKYSCSLFENVNTLDEAEKLLKKNLESAESSVQQIAFDLDFLRDQMTITEVTMARLYNWDVKKRNTNKASNAVAAS